MYKALGQVDYNDFTFADVTSAPDVSAQSSDWWSSIKDILVPVSSAAATIVKSIYSPTGAPVQVPPGYIKTPTGQIVPVSSFQTAGTNWLIPTLLIGGGALYLMSRKR